MEQSDDIQPKSVGAFCKWAEATSNRTEEKGPPCCDCGLHGICGGANRFWHTAAAEAYGEPLRTQQRPAEAVADEFYFYRRHNGHGMA